jgi:hypothetical protein
VSIYRAFHNVLRDYKHQTLKQNPPNVVFDIDSSLTAVPVDFFGLCGTSDPNPFNVIFGG